MGGVCLLEEKTREVARKCCKERRKAYNPAFSKDSERITVVLCRIPVELYTVTGEI